MFPYSVAQLSVYMANWVYHQHKDPVLALDCLFHDAAEAYLGDLRGPLKKLLPEFQQIEDNIDQCIRKNFAFLGVPARQMVKTKELDKRIVMDEMSQLFALPGPDIDFGDLEPLGITIRQVDYEIAETSWMSCVFKFSETIGSVSAAPAVERI